MSLEPRGGQTKQLIADAGRCYPYFAFYNDAKFFPALFPACGCDYHGPSYCGCLLVSAPEVQTRGSRDPVELVGVSIPLHCLLGDNGQDKDVVKAVADNLRIDLRREREPPNRILSLLNSISKEPGGEDRGYLSERKLAWGSAHSRGLKSAYDAKYT
jgi:hypothetical protein